MKLLLDTHVLLWMVSQSVRLSGLARTLLADEDNDLVFSTASLWEAAIKRGLSKKDFLIEPRTLRRALRDNGFEELPVTGDHAVAVYGLPTIHKDPFDRLLIAQAMIEGLTLITSDTLVAQYPAPIRLV